MTQNLRDYWKNKKCYVISGPIEDYTEQDKIMDSTQLQGRGMGSWGV